MSDENPWAAAKELNDIHKKLMASHPHKKDRTPEDEAAWAENIPLYEEKLGKTLVRRHGGDVHFPFQTEG